MSGWCYMSNLGARQPMGSRLTTASISRQAGAGRGLDANATQFAVQQCSVSLTHRTPVARAFLLEFEVLNGA